MPLASGGGVYEKPGEVKVWDVSRGQESLNLWGHTDQVTNVSWSPDGRASPCLLGRHGEAVERGEGTGRR